MLAWWKPEFVEYATHAQRRDHAWRVPHNIAIFGDNDVPVKDVDEAAEKYADYFWNERDGYDTEWPIDIVVFDGENYHVVSVDREYSVDFTASESTILELPEEPVDEHADPKHPPAGTPGQ
jgi:hypothetical protein